MPTAQQISAFTFPGYSFNATPAAATFVSTLVVEKTLAALVAAQTGTLSTRTDDDTGVATLSTGHGIETADVCDIYWSGGVRYGMTASVAANAVTLDGGAGDNLPVETTVVTVVVQTAIEVNFDGDDAQFLAYVYRNPSDTGAKAHLDLQDSGDATIDEADLVHETANGGLASVWNIQAGDTTPATGNRITHGAASHNSLYAGTLYILVGITAA